MTTAHRDRTQPPLTGDELATLVGFLDFHRETLQAKAAGLTAEELDRTLAPSAMTLGGMLKHLAFVEHWWFECVLQGEEYAEPWASVDWRADADWDWHSAAGTTPEELLALHGEHVAKARAAVERALATGGLEQLSVRSSRTGERFSLRWILTHMLEEYARHNGHADLIRESIDGTVGE